MSVPALLLYFRYVIGDKQDGVELHYQMLVAQRS